MLADDTSKGEHIEGEEGGAEDGTLGYATGNRLCPGVHTSQGDALGSVGEV